MRIVGVLLLVLAACSAPSTDELAVASGTIIVDTGLAGAITDLYAGDVVAVRAVGSGEAFALARRGEVDVLLVHDPDGIAALVDDGIAVSRATFARTRYIVVGPEDDPAGVSGSEDFGEALSRVADAGSPFASRGDLSGTHVAELRFWSAAGVERLGDWYTETGQGQADTLRIAGELDAYVLTDIATWLLLGDTTGLTLLADNDDDEWTDYEVVVIDGPKRAEAAAFAEFLLGPVAQNTVTTISLGWSVPEGAEP